VHQDVSLYAASLTEGESVTHTFGPGRHGWVQVVSGVVELNGEEMREGDGAALSEEPAITLSSSTGGEILVYDLA
jgi:redox-sensitive bicupin YhaK (pirin superfamily)